MASTRLEKGESVVLAGFLLIQTLLKFFPRDAALFRRYLPLCKKNGVLKKGPSHLAARASRVSRGVNHPAVRITSRGGQSINRPRSWEINAQEVLLLSKGLLFY